LKVIPHSKLKSVKLEENLEKEIEILKGIRHENVVLLHDIEVFNS